MKPLLLLIIFFILSKEDKNCRIISKITEESGQDRMYYDYCVYIDTDEFNNFEEIIIEANVRSVLIENFLYYGETPDEPIKDSYVKLTKTQKHFKWGGSNKGPFRPSYYYHFKKPETTERYLLVSCPQFISSTCCCEISFFIEMSSWAISLIVIGSIIFGVAIVIIIIICLVKRKKKRILLPHSNNDHSAPGNDYPTLTDDYSSPDKENSKPINDNSSSYINDYPPNVEDLPPPSTDCLSNKYTPNSSIYK